MLGKAGLNWWGVIGMTPLFLLLTASTIYGFARYVDSPSAHSITALFASLYAYLYIMNAVGGNGESALIFFEALAVSALTCTRVTADEHAVLASVALAGAVLTKVEGAPFALLSLASVFLSEWPWRERVRAFLKSSIGPIFALIGWIAFSVHHHLLDSYRPMASALTLSSSRAAIGLLAREASFGIGYLPWIVLFALVVIGRVRPAWPQLFVAAASMFFLLFVYARSADPGFHIAWSAMRVLLTPLLCLVFAALAASRPRRLSEGLSSVH
jgi:hypothetical protein